MDVSASVSTPLLPTSNGGQQDHPIFLRICHSSWRYFPQNVLVYVRGFIVAYLLAVGIMIADYKLGEESAYTNWRHIFDFGVISFVLAFVYNIIAFAWTFTHMYYPDVDESKRGIEYMVLRVMSLPANMSGLRKQFYCSLFFMLAIVFPFTSTATYLIDMYGTDHEEPVVLPPAETGVPQPASVLFEMHPWDAQGQSYSPYVPPFSEMFGNGWFAAFCRLNLYCVISAIGFFELFWFSSVKRPVRTMGAHVVGVAFFAILYLGWAALGAIITNWYAFPWMSTEFAGSRDAVAVFCVGFVLLALLAFILIQGFLAVRESIQKASSERRAEAAEAAAASLEE